MGLKTTNRYPLHRWKRFVSYSTFLFISHNAPEHPMAIVCLWRFLVVLHLFIVLICNDQQQNIFIVANYILNSTFPYLLYILLSFFFILLFKAAKLKEFKFAELFNWWIFTDLSFLVCCVLVYKSLFFFQLLILFWKKRFYRSTRHHAQFPLLSKLVFILYILWKTFYSIKVNIIVSVSTRLSSHNWVPIIIIMS